MVARDILQLYRVASQYYIEGKSQAEIGKKENISRSQISRMLDKARAEGLVKIEVVLPESADDLTIQSFIKNKLNLEDVIIAPVAAHEVGSEARTEAIAQTAAAYLPRTLKNSRVTGMGWGQTVYRTACLLPHRSYEKSTLFVPLIGNYGYDNPWLQVNSIVDRMAESQNGKRYFTNLPAYRSKKMPLNEQEKKKYEDLKRYWNQLDTVVIGLGGKQTMLQNNRDVLPRDLAETLADSDMTGDILAQYFREDGSRLVFRTDYEVYACPIHYFKKLPRVICLSGGPNKAEAIIAAAKEKYFNILVTDSITARELYNRSRKELTT